MTSITSTDVDNGARMTIASSFFQGKAGVRANDEGGHFAYFGALAFASALTGTADEKPFTVLSMAKSSIAAGMVIVNFAWKEAA